MTASAQDISAAATEQPSDVLRTERQSIAEQIAQISQEDSDASEDAAHRVAREEILRALQSVDALYIQHQLREVECRQLQVEAARLEQEQAELDKHGPAEPKPYSYLLLEDLQEQLAQEEDRESASSADLNSAEKLLHAAHAEWEQARRALPTKESSAQPAVPSPPQAQQGLSNLIEVQARAKVGLRQAEIAKQKLQLEVCKAKQALLKTKIAKIRDAVTFSSSDLDHQLGRLADADARLRRESHEAESRLQRNDADRQSSLRQLTETQASKEEIDAAKAAWQTAAEVFQNEAIVLDQQIENIAGLRKIWRRRYELANGTIDHQKLSQWDADLDEYIDQLDDAARSLEHRRDKARDEQAAMNSQGAKEGPAQWQERQRNSLEEMRNLSGEVLREVKAAERTARRFRNELQQRLGEASPHWSTPAEVVTSLLGTEIAGNDEQKVTLGTLLVLLVYVVAGVAAAYLLSRVIGRRLLSRFGIHYGRAVAIKSILFYTLCVVFGVLAFRLLHIPIAAFAFLGGAAAIGIGFGSQDIMNNFMSGIILLTEQPIRVGDVVEIGRVQGVVEHIGLRSTRLQTASNHELILPNKTLLDEQVTNLTLSDNLVRLTVVATVDRDTNIERAKWEMLEIAFSHSAVVKSPRPVVLLKEVDNYWLVFEVHFWLQYGSFIRSAIVQSEILEQIGDRFTSAEDKAKAAKLAAEAAAGSPATTERVDPTPDTIELAAPTTRASVQAMSAAVVAKGMKRVQGAMKMRG